MGQALGLRRPLRPPYRRGYVNPSQEAALRHAAIASDARLRKWVTWVGVIGTGLLAIFLLGFLARQTLALGPYSARMKKRLSILRGDPQLDEQPSHFCPKGLVAMIGRRWVVRSCRQPRLIAGG